MANEDSGLYQPIKQAFAEYIGRWYAGLIGDTKAVREYAERGFSLSAAFVAGRMIDQAEDMIAAYRKNENMPVTGKNSLLPILLVAMSKDMMPIMGDVGMQVADRVMVRLDDALDAPVYGYRQGFYEIRTQLLVAAAEEPTARSLASQMALFIASRQNRRFKAVYEWGQHTLQMPVTIETPDVVFSAVQNDAKNMTLLVGDMTLRATVPFLDAPSAGEASDGSNHNPPGYPVVAITSMTSNGVKVQGRG